MSEITVQHILQTATTDIAHWWANQQIRDDRREAKRKGVPKTDAKAYPLGFVPKHVARCIRESQLLQNAINDRATGASYKQPAWTRLLYDDVTKLEQALEIAKRHNR